MAINHCTAQLISRSMGRSATGAAAYRAGVMITDERSGIVHDYRRKSHVYHSMILAPEYAPEWVHDRSRLWNEVEKIEKRKDAQLCREIELALPNELTPEQMKTLLTGYVEAQFVALGMIADVNIHLKPNNAHAHTMLTLREISAGGFGLKNRDWNRKELLQQWREAWAHHANAALEQAGHEARIDHRSLEAQGIERTPQIHVGAKSWHLFKRTGIKNDRFKRWEQIIVSNNAIATAAYRRDMKNELSDAMNKKDVIERKLAALQPVPQPNKRHILHGIATRQERVLGLADEIRHLEHVERHKAYDDMMQAKRKRDAGRHWLARAWNRFYYGGDYNRYKEEYDNTLKHVTAKTEEREHLIERLCHNSSIIQQASEEFARRAAEYQAYLDRKAELEQSLLAAKHDVDTYQQALLSTADTKSISHTQPGMTS